MPKLMMVRDRTAGRRAEQVDQWRTDHPDLRKSKLRATGKARMASGGRTMRPTSAARIASVRPDARALSPVPTGENGRVPGRERVCQYVWVWEGAADLRHKQK